MRYAESSTLSLLHGHLVKTNEGIVVRKRIAVRRRCSLQGKYGVHEISDFLGRHVLGVLPDFKGGFVNFAVNAGEAIQTIAIAGCSILHARVTFDDGTFAVDSNEFWWAIAITGIWILCPRVTIDGGAILNLAIDPGETLWAIAITGVRVLYARVALDGWTVFFLFTGFDSEYH